MMRAVIFYVFLRQLIMMNYWLRYHRFLPDVWFWADELALSWGYTYNPDS